MMVHCTYMYVIIIIIKNRETIKSFFIYRLFNYLFVKETIKTVVFFLLLTLSTHESEQTRKNKLSKSPQQTRKIKTKYVYEYIINSFYISIISLLQTFLIQISASESSLFHSFLPMCMFYSRPLISVTHQKYNKVF